MIKENIFEENKETQSSLFLAQSYQDAWADYSRALKKERFTEIFIMKKKDGQKYFTE